MVDVFSTHVWIWNIEIDKETQGKDLKASTLPRAGPQFHKCADVVGDKL
jgi:hypothetical protein